MLTAAELIEDFEASRLLLFAMQSKQRKSRTKLTKHLMCKLDLATRTHEHQHLALGMRAQEREEHVKFPWQVNEHVKLL